MNHNDSVLRYKTSMAVFKKWLETGMISGEELLEIDQVLTKKYGLSSCSIYRENGLISRAGRAIYSSTKGDRYGTGCNQN
jgi:hypothetical protein